MTIQTNYFVIYSFANLFIAYYRYKNTSFLNKQLSSINFEEYPQDTQLVILIQKAHGNKLTYFHERVKLIYLDQNLDAFFKIHSNRRCKNQAPISIVLDSYSCISVFNKYDCILDKIPTDKLQAFTNIQKKLTNLSAERFAIKTHDISDDGELYDKLADYILDQLNGIFPDSFCFKKHVML